MAPHQHRVVVEKEELDAKSDALARFMDTETFCSLPGAEQERMTRQLSAMRGYSQALLERIAAFAS